MSGSSAVLVAFFAATALALTPAPGQQVTDRPHLAGEWQLNEALSEEIPLLPGERASLARGTGVLPSVSLRRKPRNGLDLHEVMRVRGVLRELLDAGRKLEVVPQDDRFIFTDASGCSTALVPGGAPVRDTHGDIAFELRARWQPPALVIERLFPDRTVVTEHYTTFLEPRQLVVTSTILNPQIDEPAATLMRVYDHVADVTSR